MKKSYITSLIAVASLAVGVLFVVFLFLPWGNASLVMVESWRPIG